MSRSRIAAAIFLITAALLLALHGQRMVLTNDEGIVLESAQRMAAGGRIYVDFFGYMSPGSYWLQALVFRLFGLATRFSGGPGQAPNSGGERVQP